MAEWTTSAYQLSSGKWIATFSDGQYIYPVIGREIDSTTGFKTTPLFDTETDAKIAGEEAIDQRIQDIKDLEDVIEADRPVYSSNEDMYEDWEDEVNHDSLFQTSAIVLFFALLFCFVCMRVAMR